MGRCRLLLAVLTVVMTGCPNPEGQDLHFSPDPLELPDALPGFSSSIEASLVNDTGQTWTVTALAVSAEEAADAERFDVVLADETAALPVALAPGELLALTVVFSPETVRAYAATLTASATMSDFTVGGGGCSAGCGGDAPEDLTVFVPAVLTGEGNEEASFEDCGDGEDNDGDGLVDCDDPDCAADPDCGQVDPEICDDGIDNDGDGRIDCEDGDCEGFEGCIDITGCDPSELFCGGFVTSDTTGAEDNWQSYCDAGFDGWDGPEEVWAYFADEPGEVNVAAFAFGDGGPGPGPGGGSWDLDLTILEARGDGGDYVCDPEACIATSWSPPGQPLEETFFFAETGALYLIVIDGWDGAAGEYELLLECFGGGFEGDCGDGLDNDDDGLVDCDDPDCFGTPECAPEGYCAPIIDGECGGFYSASNNADFSTNEVIDYCDEGFDGWTGPEVAMFFFPDFSGEVSVSLTGLSDDLDLTVLLADLTAPSEDELCNPELCIGEDWAGGANPETVTFDAFAGTAYIFVVDGWAGAISQFDLTIDCGDAPLEFCDNGLDDDGDGLVDCDDPDCFGFPDCVGGVEICDDGLDNDGDGDADCDDVLDCQAFPGCDYGDGDCCTDNGDPGCENELGEDCVCAIDPFCCTVEWDFICADEYENLCGGTCGGPVAEVCDNGLDDDGDGLVDCDDADCGAFPDCVTPTVETICDNTVDDDADGLTDCADPDCAGDPNCVPGTEDCANGLDDDGDGAVDCDDSDCTFDAACDAGDGDCCVSNGTPGCDDEAGEDLVCALDPFCCNVTWDFICADEYENVFGGTCADEICDNGLDDDGDGQLDCDDLDCAGDPACPPPAEINCVNGFDDDFDGLIDCDDPDCQGTPACAPVAETICDNNLDDDGDGLFDCADPDCAADPNCITPGTETNCANGIDDDADGAVDCDDADCTFDPNCNIVLFEICDNGLDDDADGDVDCDDSDCASFPSCVNPPESNCANGIDDDADGWTDCNDPDCALDPNCATGEDCDNGVDDDGDGDVDCDDSDCSADLACVDPGECSPIQNITCGDVIASSNTAPGSTDDIDEWCGNPLPPGWTGPEITYLFTPTADGFVDITLSGLSEDLDIQAVVEDDGCDPEDCEANGWNPPPQDEQMDWFAFQGTPYYIVIDGWNGAESSFTMTVTCTPLEETGFCDNGIDDDEDGDVDCADVDCLGDAACPELDCSNGIDDDADGHIDCADPDCQTDPTCIPESNCVDGIDNDFDGAVDCDDSDCASAPACNVPEDCEDGIDNDGDGDVDCDDDDCDDDPVCDDDPGDGECCIANGTPGCEDEVGQACVCALDPYCCNVTWDAICADEYDDACGGDCSTTNPEICGNGLDDDADGDEDCFDSDCELDPFCDEEADCANGFDDDADGATDCDDVDCFGEPGCPLVIFSSVDDDPADFINFSLSNHASSVIWEQGVPDTTTQSGSGPTAPYAGTASWCTGCDEDPVDGGRFNAYLIAQPLIFDLSPYSGGTLELTWRHWQVSPGFPAFDITRAEVSDDGGATVDVVWGPFASSTLGWTFELVDLSTYLGGDLTVGFRLDSITGIDTGNDGWYIDDVELIYYP